MPQVVLLVALILVVVAQLKSAQQAFLDVYLPAMFLLPAYFFWTLDGLPDPTFLDMAAIPLILFCGPALARWRFSIVDLMILPLALVALVSEVKGASVGDAIAVGYRSLCDILLPYIYGKTLIDGIPARNRFARRIVTLLLLASLLSPLEALNGNNYFSRGFSHFFPGQDGGWYPQGRYGIYRASGPFGHSILAGIFFAAGIVFHRWQSARPGVGLSKLWRFGVDRDTAIMLALLLASALTLSRGPWIGMILALIVMSAGWTRRPGRAFAAVLAVVAVLGVAGYSVLMSYTDLSPSQTVSEDQSSAAYRRALLDKYETFAEDGGLWGWGVTNRPAVPGMFSVDNNYLLMRIQNGTAGLTVFVTLLVTVIVRLFASALLLPPRLAEEKKFRFTLGAVLVLISFSIATVYLGLQLQPFLFLMIGLAEITVMTRPAEGGIEPAEKNETLRRGRFAFEGVLT